MSQPTRVTRQQLYEAVWSTSLTQVAKEYGVSDVAIRKRCIRNNIPLPPKARKNLKRPPLPGDPTIEMLIVPDTRGGQRLLMAPTPVLGAKGLDKSDIVVKFPRTLKKAHLLVQKTIAILKKAKIAHDGILISRTDWLPLLVQVSQRSRDRTLLFMDGIVRGLEALGVQVDEHGAHIEGVLVRFGVTEQIKRKTIPRSDGTGNRNDDVPSGLLRLRVIAGGFKRDWDETPGRSIESQGRNFIYRMFVTAGEVILAERRMEEFKKQWAAKNQAEEILRRREKEVQQVHTRASEMHERLIEASRAWENSNRVTRFIDTLEAATERPTPGEAAYFSFARQQACAAPILGNQRERYSPVMLNCQTRFSAERLHQITADDQLPFDSPFCDRPWNSAVRKTTNLQPTTELATQETIRGNLRRFIRPTDKRHSRIVAHRQSKSLPLSINAPVANFGTSAKDCLSHYGRILPRRAELFLFLIFA